jgi:hypothetical protein
MHNFNNLQTVKTKLITTALAGALTFTSAHAQKYKADVPAGVLGLINDAYFRFVCDMGQFGPDQGKGGKFLSLPKGYTGAVPKEGYYVFRTPTYNNLVIIRSFLLCTDQYCTRYMVGTRGKGEVRTASNHLGFRCVKPPATPAKT